MRVDGHVHHDCARSSRNARYQADYGLLYMSRIVVAIGQETIVDDETHQLIVSVGARGRSLHHGKCLFLAVDLCEIRFNAPGRLIGERCGRFAQQAFQVSVQKGKYQFWQRLRSVRLR